MAIHLRSADEIEKMHRAGLIVHEVLNTLRSSVRPGMTTMDLEKIAEGKIAGKPGHRPSKGIAGIPACSAPR
jgi:methionyl aminopeptidase